MDDGGPALEMLWESTDPGQALTERFGFADGSAAAGWVADVLRHHWKLDVVRCDRLVISARNAMAWVEAGGRPLIVKWSSEPQRFARLAEAAQVVAWLDTRGIPVAAPLVADDGRLLVEQRSAASGRLRSRLPMPGARFLIGVLPVVAGDLLDVDDPAHVAEAGRMLATLHHALADHPGPIAGRRRGPSQQLVHHDFRSANILHDGTGITAVLDFEEMTWATRVADLARSAVLLGTRYRDWGPTSAEVRAAYVGAYDAQAQVPLSDTERRELDAGISAVLKHFDWS